jgi:outer membrane protein assembly factor BamE (lipoprotein component of BamABCDE complex)
MKTTSEKKAGARIFRRTRFVILAMMTTPLLGGCISASEHQADVSDSGPQTLTAGKVQREIRVGMSGSEVASVLGSPNIVSTDVERREVWIYDRISTVTAYSTSRGSISALVLGGSGDVGAGGLGGVGVRSGARSTSQKILTVVVKFSDEGLVRDFSYHASRF